MDREKLVYLKTVNRKDLTIYMLLSTIIGECDRIGKDLLEKDILSIMKKIYKNNEISMNTVGIGDIEIEILKKENSFLEEYIPKQLTEVDIINIINEYRGNHNADYKIGEIMKYFKDLYNGLYDGKIVSQLANKMLKE